jgi:hypothetical protein
VAQKDFNAIDPVVSRATLATISGEPADKPSGSDEFAQENMNMRAELDESRVQNEILSKENTLLKERLAIALQASPQRGNATGGAVARSGHFRNSAGGGMELVRTAPGSKSEDAEHVERRTSGPDSLATTAIEGEFTHTLRDDLPLREDIQAEMDLLKKRCENLERRGANWKEQQRALRLALRDLPKQIYRASEGDSEWQSDGEDVANASGADTARSERTFDWRTALRKLLNKLAKLQEKADDAKADAQSLRAASRLLLDMKHSQEVAVSRQAEQLSEAQRELDELRCCANERDEYICQLKCLQIELHKRKQKVYYPGHSKNNSPYYGMSFLE